MFGFFLSSIDSSTSQFRTERIKIPPARYPRSTGSDRGSLAVIMMETRSASRTQNLKSYPPPLPLQGPSHIQSAAAQHLRCPPSTWRRHPSPAANHRAPFLLNPGYRSVLLQLATGGRKGKPAAHPDGCSALFCLEGGRHHIIRTEPHFVLCFISVLCCSPIIKPTILTLCSVSSDLYLVNLPLSGCLW